MTPTYHGANSPRSAVRRLHRQSLALAMSLASACSSADSNATSASCTACPTPRAVVRVSVGPDSASVAATQTLQLVATAFDAAGSVVAGRPIGWSTRDSSLATVDGTGLLTAISPGTAIVNASIDNAVGSATVTILPIPIASITIVPASPRLIAGSSLQLSATLTDSRGAPLTGRVVVWGSSNTAAVTIDASTGLAKGVLPGNAVVTASSEGHSGSALISVVVSPTAQLAHLLDSARRVNDLPALAAAIVTRDSVWALGAVGVRRYGGTIAVTVNDQFHLGSDLKSMTAGLLGQLVDQGRVQWTSTLSELFPELVATMRPEYRAVTVRDLLSQQSGFEINPTVDFVDPTPMQQRASFVQWLVQQPPVAPRGTFYYSNCNFMVAGAIAERLTGVAYEQLIVDRLFSPLGMTSVGWGAAGTPGQEDEPWQHYIDASGNHVAVPPGPFADNPPVMSPAGRAHMAIGDWALWIRAVLRAEAGQSSLWTSSTAKMLTTPAVSVDVNDGYALGWFTTNRSWAAPTGRTLDHTGSNTKNFASAWLAPDGGFGVIVVTNQGGDVAGLTTDAVAGLLVGVYLSSR